MDNFIFCIYSCKKRMDKAIILYEMLVNKLNNCKLFIVFGELNTLDMKYTIILDKFIVLNCGDHYENLSEKSIKLFQMCLEEFPNTKGVFKCDDDLLPNIDHINGMINFINTNDNINYLGKKGKIITNSSWHFGKCFNKNLENNIKLPKGNYCSGEFYYVSNLSLQILKNCNTCNIFNEDACVAYNLTKNHIKIYNYKTFNKNFKYVNKISINNNNKNRKLFVKINEDGRKIETASKIAKKNNLFLILLNYREVSDYICIDEEKINIENLHIITNMYKVRKNDKDDFLLVL